MRQLKINNSITNRSDSLDKYLQEVAKEEMVSQEEEVILAQKIKQGDKAALDKLTKANLRFVVSVAKKYQNQWLSLPDLINEWNLGLIKAAQKFDETRGFKFISYAVWRIRQSILQALAENARIVRLPLNRVGSLNKINKAKWELEQILQRVPNEEDLAEMLDLPFDEIYKTLNMAWKHTSLDAPLNNEDTTTLEDKLENDEFPDTDQWLMDESRTANIKNALNTLDPREAKIIELFFWLNWVKALTLEEIGEDFGLTRERVRQIKEKGIRRLKHTSRSKNLKQYLGK